MPRGRKARALKRRLVAELHRLEPFRQSTMPSAPTRHIPDPTSASRVWYGRGFPVP